MLTRPATVAHPLRAYVGTYGDAPNTQGGGIFTLNVARDGTALDVVGHAPEPRDAGYLVYAANTRTLYSVDERKTDGRGPIAPPAAVHALSVSPSGDLRWLNSLRAPGPRPTFLSLSAKHHALLSANHGDFQHVEKVKWHPNKGSRIDYIYDDSTVVLFGLGADGSIETIRDVRVLKGHGEDPNHSPQNGGHAQASAHAHCAVIDPTGKYVLVCDKGTDQILVFRLRKRLAPVSSLQLSRETGPRHLVFDPISGRVYATLELSSELACLEFDCATGTLLFHGSVSTVASGFSKVNEPAEVRVHPAGRFVYVNNRGEDSLAWFDIRATPGPKRIDSVPLATSAHPGLAARSFTFDPTGEFLLVADRPAHRVRSYRVNRESGALSVLSSVHIPDPAYIVFVDPPFPDCAQAQTR